MTKLKCIMGGQMCNLNFKACLKEYDPVLYLEMNAIYTLDGWMRVSL